jgi:homocysteine S-methyltransferase
MRRPFSYQCSFDTFERAGLSRQEAKRIMLRTVELTSEARKLYVSQNEGCDRPKVALSLGPFGASLSPAQEFDGFYPPPYGPKAYSTTERNCNHIISPDQEELAVEALAKFHYERIMVFANHEPTWNEVDCIALETVPLQREVTAIRRAIGKLPETKRKPWWISLVFPEGQFPGADAEGKKLQAATAFRTVFEGFSPETPTPSAVGINCTSAKWLPDLLNAVEDTLRQTDNENLSVAPWVVVYPNGGDTYDIATQTWTNSDTVTRRAKWLSCLQAVAHRLKRECILGGCCRTGPADIAELSRILRQPSDMPTDK